MLHEEFISATLQNGGWKCAICSGPVLSDPRIVSMCRVISRGARTCPKTLRKNYVRAAIVCSENCARNGATIGAATYLDMETSTRIISEDRAQDEPCDIEVLSASGISNFIAQVIAREIDARLTLLIAQTRTDDYAEVADTLSAIWRVWSAMATDDDFAQHFDDTDFISPFEYGSANSRVFERALSVFAIFARDDAHPAREISAFEEAIVGSMQRALSVPIARADDTSAEYCVATPGIARFDFPMQIYRARGKKTILRFSSRDGSEKAYIGLHEVP